jgi:hypothetical protein
MNWTHLFQNVRHPLKAYLRNPHHIIENVRWRWAPSTSSDRHVFVVGAPRSGTTLLQILLGNHPACCTWEAETAVFTWQNVFTSQKEIFGLEASHINELFRDCGDIVEFLMPVPVRSSVEGGGGGFSLKKRRSTFCRLRS